MLDAKTIWRRMLIAGSCVTLAGWAAVALSFGGVSPFEAFGEDVFWPVIIGLLVCGIASIGWASQVGRRPRVVLAALTIAPLPLIWVGGAISNANIHGIFAL